MKRLVMAPAVLAATMALVLAGCDSSGKQAGHEHHGTSEQEAPQTTNNDVSSLNWRVPDFTFTDQGGKPFGLKDLKGKFWLADFVFTRCPDVCPPMTANMARVQEHLKKAGVSVEIVSFSVDPEYDTPERLTAFAEDHQADLSTWHFLTGYKVEEIEKIAMEAFKGPVRQQKSPSPEVPILVTHPTQFYLIDDTGKVVRFYDGLKPDPDRILEDVKQLTGK
ncbi:SCO family protein [Staphylospora marina]|uniref:SCO family protein n=1 Tax=Staphylospora marina TaxID=2490858 RepID=UPI000F5BC6AA|nr:SCO family protein [Staphylospora marina]